MDLIRLINSVFHRISTGPRPHFPFTFQLQITYVSKTDPVTFETFTYHHY